VVAMTLSVLLTCILQVSDDRSTLTCTVQVTGIVAAMEN